MSNLEFDRQVVIVGNGCRGADLTPIFESKTPIVTSWGGADLVADHPNHIGHCGIFGDRASNLAVQSADALLVLGCRMSVPMTGHNFEAFAPKAEIFMVDIDKAEIEKPALRNPRYRLQDVGDFLSEYGYVSDGRYLQQCLEWKAKYDIHKETRHLQSYAFIERLSEELPDDAIVVTDMGTAFTCTFQAAKMRKGQRWFTAYGHAPMGYGIPGAIGAHYASGKPVVCIVGDGSMMFNIQELQTISHNKLPIKIYLLENGGYLTMKHTFQNHFGRQVGSDLESGVSFPNWEQVAKTFGVEIDVIKMDQNQPLIPRVQSVKNEDGTITAKPLDDMYPYMPVEEFS